LRFGGRGNFALSLGHVLAPGSSYYRDQIAALREALANERAHVQAAELIRKLVDKIVLTPVEEEGRTSLSIDLHGHLAGILSLATKAKRPLNESGPELRWGI
jgi:site-specific DNA recombinase